MSAVVIAVLVLICEFTVVF